MTTATSDITRVAEDYLTLIWKAEEWPDGERRPTTSDLAAALRVTLSTVSANLKRLARERLIDYEPYGSIALTSEGEQIAIEVVRRHRIIETFLVEHVGLAWDEVHDEADRLEHAASAHLIDRMDALLRYPAVDPHGDRIPRPGLNDQAPAMVLAACTAGETVRVVRVSDRHPDILRFLAARNIAIDSALEITAAMSATGLMTIRHGDDAVQLSSPIARAIRVTAA